jgi:hypothetical protein
MIYKRCRTSRANIIFITDTHFLPINKISRCATDIACRTTDYYSYFAPIKPPVWNIFYLPDTFFFLHGLLPG